MLDASPSPADAGPLTVEHRRQLEEAGRRARTFLAASRLATFSGWTVGVFAAITLLAGLTSMTALVLGAGMAVVARNAFRGRTLLRRLNPAGPRLLGRNELGFMALIIGYCLWSIVRTVHGAGPWLGELEALVGDAQDLITDVMLAVYGAIILATLLLQGLSARYYFKRVNLIRAYLEDTPAWIVEIQRSDA